MISPICYICKKELEDFGAILWSPPDKNNKHDKYHICVGCWSRKTLVINLHRRVNASRVTKGKKHN